MRSIMSRDAQFLGWDLEEVMEGEVEEVGGVEDVEAVAAGGLWFFFKWYGGAVLAASAPYLFKELVKYGYKSWQARQEEEKSLDNREVVQHLATKKSKGKGQSKKAAKKEVKKESGKGRAQKDEKQDTRGTRDKVSHSSARSQKQKKKGQQPQTERSRKKKGEKKGEKKDEKKSEKKDEKKDEKKSTARGVKKSNGTMSHTSASSQTQKKKKHKQQRGQPKKKKEKKQRQEARQDVSPPSVERVSDSDRVMKSLATQQPLQDDDIGWSVVGGGKKKSSTRCNAQDGRSQGKGRKCSRKKIKGASTSGVALKFKSEQKEFPHQDGVGRERDFNPIRIILTLPPQTQPLQKPADTVAVKNMQEDPQEEVKSTGDISSQISPISRGGGGVSDMPLTDRSSSASVTAESTSVGLFPASDSGVDTRDSLSPAASETGQVTSSESTSGAAIEAQQASQPQAIAKATVGVAGMLGSTVATGGSSLHTGGEMYTMPTTITTTPLSQYHPATSTLMTYPSQISSVTPASSGAGALPQSLPPTASAFQGRSGSLPPIAEHAAVTAASTVTPTPLTQHSSAYMTNSTPQGGRRESITIFVPLRGCVVHHDSQGGGVHIQRI